MTASPAASTRRRLLWVLAALLASPLLAELALRRVGARYDPAEAEREARRILEVALGDEGGSLAQAVEASSDAAARSARALAAKQSNVLHPYFGYENKAGLELFERYVREHREDPDAFTVLVFGGSVAEIFTGLQRGGADHLRKLLKADPRMADRRVAPCRMARAGYKQPQALLQLAYFLSLGCVPDVVVNIDGLNAIKLAPRNLRSGTPPSWPEANHWLHQSSAGGLDLVTLDKLLDTRDRQRELIDACRGALDSHVLRFALTGRGRLTHIYELRDEWVRTQETYLDALKGSRRVTPSEEELDAALVDAADCWEESTRLMKELCDSKGTLFLSCLQPTLHDLGSKPIAEQERERCLPEEGVDPRIRAGYDLLRARGAELRAEGVAFVDTSYLFSEIEEPLYYDRAHFGERGNRLLAERIAEEILARL